MTTQELDPLVPRPNRDLLARAHMGLIAQAPIEITILREVTEHQGTHRADWRPEPEGGIATVARVALAGGGSSNVSDVLTGHQERDTSWGLLLPPGLPLRSGDGEDGRSRLEFVHPAHGRLRIRRLRPIWPDIDGRIVGWQADLERIAGATPMPTSVGGGRPRLEDDPEHPWRQILLKADELRGSNPRLTWDQIAAQVGTTRERLDEYRRRARGVGAA